MGRHDERRFAHITRVMKSRHGRGVRWRAQLGTAATGLGGWRGVRGCVAREEWGRNVGGAPLDPPALAAWRPWGLGVRAGPRAWVHGVGAPGARRRALCNAKLRWMAFENGLPFFNWVFLKILKQKWTEC
jgi:hypothetical protein